MSDNLIQPRVPRQRRWGLRIGLILLIIILLLPIAHAIWGIVAQHALDAEIARIRQAGEPVLPEDLNQPPVDPALNAVPELRAAATAIDPHSEAWKFVEGPERTLALPLTPVEQSNIRAVVEENASAFAHVRAATTRPSVDWGIRYTSPVIAVLLPDLSEQRDLANLLSVAVLLAHEDGDDATAIGHLREMLFISRAVNQQTTLVSHLVATGVAAMVAGKTCAIAPDLRVSRDAAARGTARDAEVRQLIGELLDERPSLEGYRRALRGERVMELDSVQVLMSSKPNAFGSSGGPAGAAPSGRKLLLSYIVRPMLLEDSVLLSGHISKGIELCDLPTWPQAKAQLPDLSQIMEHRVRHFVAVLLLPSLDRFANSHFRSLTDRRLAATVLAIRLFAADHDGNLPPDLDALVPQYLPSIPIDAMAPVPQPLRYLTRSSDPILYSVGDNGTDDGGSEADPTRPPGASWPQSLWTTLDAVRHLTRQPRPPAPPGFEDEADVASPRDRRIPPFARAATRAVTRPSP